MTVLEDAGELMIGTRLKRLGERLYSEVGQVYQRLGIPFEPSWFPLFFLLDRKKEIQVTDLSRAVGVSNPAASQMVAQLQKRGWVKTESGRADKRFRTVKLSDQGRKLLKNVRPVWTALKGALAEMESGPDELRKLMNLVGGLEEGLNQEGLAGRVERRLHTPLKVEPLPVSEMGQIKKWRQSIAELFPGNGETPLNAWICSQGGTTRGWLAATESDEEDRIVHFDLDVWNEEVCLLLIETWAAARKNQPWLSASVDPGRGEWSERLASIGFQAASLLPVTEKNSSPLLLWRRLNPQFQKKRNTQ